jgi:ABC-type bacteriocin/lantibiotic exporter with double-glycine peptidase domain
MGIETPGHGVPMLETRDLIEFLSARNGVEFDTMATREAIAQAEREFPSHSAAHWFEVLYRVGKDSGLRVTPVERTVRGAMKLLGDGGLLVAYAPTRRTWIVLDSASRRQVRVVEDRSGSKTRWISTTELAGELGASSVDAPVRWGAVQALAPLEDVRTGENRTPLNEGRDLGHGEGHGLGHGPGHDAGHGHGGGHEHLPPLRRLLALLRPERGDIRVVVLFALAVGVLSLAVPLAVEAMVTTVAFNRLYGQLLVLSMLLLGCLSFAAVLRAMQTYVVEIMQRRVFIRLVADLSYRLPRVTSDAYDRQYGPELVNRFFDVLTVQKVGASLLLDGVAVILQTVIGLLVLGFYHPFLLGFDIVLIIAIGFVVFVLGRGAVESSIRESRAKYAVAGCLEEMALRPAAYKSSGGPELAFDRADALARRYLSARRDHFRVLFRQITFSLALQAIASVALLSLGGWLVMDGQLTLGQLVAAELIVATVAASLAKLGKHLEGYYDLMAAVDKLGHLIDLPMERQDGEAMYQEGAAAGAALRMSHVGYRYPTSHHGALHDLNLTVAPGERVALVGPSGSGKRTLGSLLYGLRTPTDGRIEIDGSDIRDLRLDALRRRVALVQDPDIIEGTILDNVRMGRNLSLWEVRRALEKVALLDEVTSLPDSLHTRLSTTAAPLTQRQARRLMLARAIVGKPRLLVLDDLLDTLERSLRERLTTTLFDRAAPWTLLIVSQNPEIIRLCDRSFALPKAHHGPQTLVAAHHADDHDHHRGDGDADDPETPVDRLHFEF